MRKTFALIFFITLTLNCFAQDYISLKDGTKKTVMVLEITPDVVKYRDFDNQTGALYTIPKTDVTKILFQNGKEEIFTSEVKMNQLEYIGNKVYLNGEKLSGKEVKNMFQGTNALPLYNKSKMEKGTGLACSLLGAGLLGWGLGCVSSDIIQPQSSSWTQIITGAAILGSGFYLSFQSSKTMEKAIDTYNKSSKTDALTFNVGMVGNGLGIQLVF